MMVTGIKSKYAGQVRTDAGRDNMKQGAERNDNK